MAKLATDPIAEKSDEMIERTSPPLLQRLSIRQKAFAAFGLMFCFLIVLGLFSLQRLGIVTGAIDLMLDQEPGARSLTLARIDFERLTSADLLAHFAQSPAEQAALAAKADLANTAAHAAYADYVATGIDPGVETKLHEATAKAWQDFDALRQTTRASELSGALAEADRLFLGDLSVRRAAAIDALKNTYDFQRRQIAQFGRKGSASVEASRIDIFALLAVAAALTIIIGWLVKREICAPIKHLTQAMRQLANQDMSVELPAANRRDEVGEMGAAVRVFRDNMIQSARIEAEQEEARAARTRRQDNIERETELFGRSITTAMDKLTNSADDMRNAAGAMTTASSVVHAEATNTSSGAERSSRDLSSTASAVEELITSFSEIARQVASATQTSHEAVRRAEASQATIASLTEATGRIGEVVNLIDQIASQTNLLALNATIEAARAGDAGKGFAVVAGEVKALAAQTANATAEIGRQISTVKSATIATVTAVRDVCDMIGGMANVATAMAAATEQQSMTTREIANSVQTVSHATLQSAAAMVQVVELAGQAGAASEVVVVGAATIGQEAGVLRAEVGRFLQAVRAGA